jgi:hypothetical protein
MIDELDGGTPGTDDSGNAFGAPLVMSDHLKWGEARWWSGNKDEARKQFARAASLDLSPADRRALQSRVSTHG